MPPSNTVPPAVTTDGAEQDPSERQQLGRHAARGVVVTMGAQGVKIVLQVLGVVVLARLLTPGDYGLVAMVTAIIGVAEIFRDFGLSAAAIQAKTLSRAQRDNLFWINTAAGGGFTILTYFTAPLIALLYHRPELVGLSQALCFVFLLNGLGTQYRADLTRRLKFGNLAIVEIAAPTLALTAAIVSALNGAGYWSLAVQQLTTAVVLVLGNAISARWIPRLPRKAPMRPLFKFGWQLAGSLFIGYLGNNIDSLTIGIRFNATSLGLYNRAFQLLMTPLGQLRAPTTNVALPVLSRLREDREASQRYLQRGQNALGFTLVAGVGFVLGASEPITKVFLGDQWTSVIPILRLLAAAGIFQSLAYVGLWIYLSHGLTKELLQYTVMSVTVKVACILIGSHWGVIGVAWGYAIHPALAWPISFWWLRRHSFVDVRPLLAGAGRIVALTTALAAGSWTASWLGRDLHDWLQLLCGIGGAVIVYLLALALVPPVRRSVTGVADIVLRAARRR